MAVEGEWAWPRCIGCGKDLKKKRPRDFRYGMDVCCANCINRVGNRHDSYQLAWDVRQCEYSLQAMKRAEDHDNPVAQREWQALAERYARAWARLRDFYQMPPFPAGLELFMVEIHNDRSTHALARG